MDNSSISIINESIDAKAINNDQSIKKTFN